MGNSRLLAACLFLSSAAHAAPDLSRIRAQIESLTGTPAPEIVEPSAPRGSPVASDVSTAQREWTVMLFLNGKNNLSRAIEQDLEEAAQVGSSERVDVVAQIGSFQMSFVPDRDPGTFKTRRFHLLADGKRSEEPLGDKARDMGDWKELAEFVAWAKRSHPAKKYLLVINNHGNGIKGISFDDQTKHSISVPELHSALAATGGVDVLAMDACLMQMAEVIYEIRNDARVVVGSEELEPGNGYDYARFLGALAAKPAIDAEQFGRATVDAYRQAHAGEVNRITTSAVRTREFPEFLRRLDAWIDAMDRDHEWAGLGQALAGNVNRFRNGAVDVWKLLDSVDQATEGRNVRDASWAVRYHLYHSLVIQNTGTHPYRLISAHGLSVHVPARFDLALPYQTLAWSRETRWKRVMEKAVEHEIIRTVTIRAR
jgi:hypothetical protein